MPLTDRPQEITAKKVLIIEDDAIQILAVRDHLEQAGFAVFSAMNGEDGLKKAREHRPDLVLLDIILPGMTGLEACQRLKEDPATKHARVIIVTASSMSGLKERSRLFGVDDCLIKPYAFSDLTDLIGRLLEIKAQDEV